MKRVVCIAVLVLVCLSAHAQLTIKEKTSKIETLATIGMGIGKTSLNCQDNQYFIATNTTNRFDEPFILEIGNGKDSAISTLQDLINLFGNIEDGASIIIDNGGEDCTIHPASSHYIHLYMHKYAGHAVLSKNTLRRFLTLLKKTEKELEEDAKYQDAIYR